MITGKDKNSCNIFYQQIIDYLHSDKFTKDAKDILRSENFQSTRNKINSYFKSPIQHLKFIQKDELLLYNKARKIQKEYFYSKGDKRELRKTFVLYSTFSDFDTYYYFPYKDEVDDWKPLLNNFKKENKFLEGEELDSKIQQYLTNQREFGENPFKKNHHSKNHFEYIEYIYRSNNIKYVLSVFFENLYFDDESNTLKYLTKENFKKYQDKGFRVSNFTTLNSFATKRSKTAIMRIFRKFVPYYYSYLSGLITEKQFLPVFVSEMREYILETLKVRMMGNLNNSLLSQKYSESFLRHLSFEYNNGSILKRSINEFSTQEQKHLLKLMSDISNKQLFDENLELCIYLEEKLKGE